MKSFLITIIACLLVICAAAKTNKERVEKKITKINALYPSFEQELKVSPVTTWGYRAGFNILLAYGSSNSINNYYQGSATRTKYFEFISMVEVYYRWYYNLLNRQQKGKKTINNSAEYFFTGAEVMTPGIKIQSVNNNGLNDIISGVYAGWEFEGLSDKKSRSTLIYAMLY